MNIGIFLPIGSSLKDLKQSGQDKRFVQYYLKQYLRYFKKVYVFSYENEIYPLPRNCFLINNKNKVHRFYYQFLLPFFHRKTIKQINIFRVMQLTGTIPAIISKVIFKKPFIVTYGYDYPAFAKLEGQKTKPILLKILEKIAMEFPSFVIVTNRLLFQSLICKYSKTRFIYLPNGVDINKFKPINKSLITNHQSLITNLLFVGRLEKQKNLDSLIKAVALLRNYKISLLFIGRGRLTIKLVKLAHKLKVNLKIIEKVVYDKLVNYYHQADIFCLPSLVEGQPKALLEAMACGLPCLAGEYSGVEEFKDRQEILKTGFKATEIAKKLKMLIEDNNLRKKLSLNSSKRIRKDFDINKLLTREIKILKQTGK